ncbi:isochorismatase family protein [Microvirga sp. 17 mud 1-3]|uniref:isochorismatase family protein n=1 Tax=Microvirga sp. 17 mud 1-3 TaxID=2082949 RepID=UPI000D6B1991|nr:isochorismatase family protein [Microvirga sp. 17 mud 1-3]AWM88682.1 hydrolase [Microvirga sp. 17 mud 1-3]
MLKLEARSTALILVDVQNGTLAQPLTPNSRETVIANSVALANGLSRAGGTLVLVRVNFSAGYRDRPKGETDVPMILPEGGLPAEWSTFPPEIAALNPDVLITKRQWSAFFGTELDLQLRRRGIDTVVIGGLMTNFGVESTARDAWQLNYATLVAQDAASSLGDGLHDFAVSRTLPRVARIRSTSEILAALAA